MRNDLKKARRDVAIANLKERLALTDAELFTTAKRFRSVDLNQPGLDLKAAADSYREYMNKHLAKLEKML